MTELTSFQSWAVVLGLAVGTFLIRYSFIGVFADRDMPAWLDRALKLMVPAIFAAIVFSGVAMVGRGVVPCCSLLMAITSSPWVLPCP